MKNGADDEQRKALKNAIDKCAETVNRTLLSVLALALFCLLSTFGADDRSLVAAEASIRGPFTEAQISFVGFLIVAPLLLGALIIYLHVFYGQWLPLDAERRAKRLIQTYPALFNIEHWVARLLTAFGLYWLVPLILAAITWKAAARLEWGLPLGVVTVLVIGVLAYLIVRRAASRWQKLHAVALGLIGLLAVIAPVPTVAIIHHRNLRYRQAWERPLDLFRVDLKGAWLQGARLYNARLLYADLTGASLNWAKLAGADLTGASLNRAKLAGAGLARADLTGAKLSGAMLAWAKVVRATLDGADLTEAILGQANFASATLTGAKLAGANLDRATFREANLTGAKLTEADLTEANLTGANLTRANLSGANLSGADLSSVKESLTCDQVRAAKTDKTTKLPVALVCPGK